MAKPEKNSVGKQALNHLERTLGKPAEKGKGQGKQVLKEPGKQLTKMRRKSCRAKRPAVREAARAWAKGGA